MPRELLPADDPNRSTAVTPDEPNAVDAARESEARLRQIIDLVPHMIFAKDRQGRFVLVNRVLAEAYGTTVEELEGRRELELHASAAEMQHFLANDHEVMQSGQPKFIPEETWTGADGQVRILETTKIPVTLAGSSEPGVLGVAVDITRRKRIEQDLKSLNETLEHRIDARTRTLMAMADGLRQNAAQMRLIVEAANDAFISMDSAGIIQDWNPQAELTFGWSAAEAIGREVVETIVPPQYREAHRNGLERFFVTGEGSLVNRRLEITALNRDGREFPVQLSIIPLRQDDTILFHAFLHDISERRQLHEQSGNVTARLALPVREFDAAATLLRLNDFSLKDMNECGAAIRGMSVGAARQEDVADNVVRFFYEHLVDEQGRKALALVRCFETRPYEELEDELKAVVDASLEHPADYTNCMTLVATAGDEANWNDARSSAGHRAIPLPSEEAVERLPMISQLIRQLGLPVGGVVKGDRDILLDTLSTEVFHVPEAVGSPYIPAQQEFVIPFGIRSVVGFGDVLPNGRLFVVIMFAKIPISRETARLFSHLSLSVRIALLPFVEIDNKSETQLVAIDRLLKNQEEIVAHQESQLRTSLENLSRANAELERSNVELQQFAYSASHDLQEPLRSISGFCQLLQRHYKGRLDGQAEEWIDYAVQGAGRMRELIEDLLLYCDVGSQEVPFKPADCSAVFDETVAALRSSIEECSAQVTRDELPIVMGNRSQLSHIMRNLIGNGIKFHGEKAPLVHVSARRDGNQWVLAVRDNGLGIPSHKVESVFDMFERLHSQHAYPGTGIGLAICRRIVERHNGRIWVESEPGKGSTFFFTLPAVNGHQEDDP